MDNLLLLTDSYKVSHWGQYPPKTETVYSSGRPASLVLVDATATG